MTAIEIRPEVLTDFAALHTLHILAFEHRIDEAALVALLRTRQQYDAALSLVAVADGEVIGHALFNPMQLYINGEGVAAVNLAPLAVHPAYHQQGIGTQLMHTGHKIAQQQGYDCSILLGHTTYYPRFGYRVASYGISTVTVPTDTLAAMPLEIATPTPDDVLALTALHQQNERAVDLAYQPELSLAEWLSPHNGVPCQVYRQDDQIVGYTRGTAEDVRFFMARDTASAQAIAHILAHGADEITLPLHPASTMVGAFDAQPHLRAWDGAMLCPLQTDGQGAAYLARLDAGGSIGRVIWPSVFDIAG